MSRYAAFALLAALALPVVASAADFRIDASGAKPRKYRLTALCKGIDTWLTPEVYKSGLFQSAGSSLKASPHPDLLLGLEGDRIVLVEDTSWNGEDVRIVGDASNLDDIRLAPGVVIEGHTEWDMASQAWRVRSNTRDLGDKLPAFGGTLLGFDWARDTALGMAAGTQAMHQDNFRVLSSALTSQWWNLIDPNDHHDEVAYYMTKATEGYLAPMQAAMAAADDAGRARLAALHDEVAESAEEILAYYRKDTWRPEVYVGAFEALVQALHALQR